MFQAAFADDIDFFFFAVSQYLEEFFFALGAEVGSIDHLFGVFGEDFYAVVGCAKALIDWAHGW